MAVFHLKSPLKDEDIAPLRVGDIVYLSGPAFTCRSRLHRHVFDEKNTLPFPTADRNILIHTGPVVVREDGTWRLVSFMPTSSIRFEKWGARSVDQWGLKLICGKTTMGRETTEMMKKKKCVHVSPQCVSPNLWIDSIRIEEVHLMEELGSIEASWFLTLDELGPFVVDIDILGNNLFAENAVTVDANREKAYEKLGIPKDYEYTKLY